MQLTCAFVFAYDAAHIESKGTDMSALVTLLFALE